MHTDTNTNAVIIEQGKPFEALIAEGLFQWVNPDISPETFPIIAAGFGQYELKIFHFSGRILSEDALAAILADDTQLPWTPAKIEHLLAYAVKTPQDERDYPIVALGSTTEIEGITCAPCIDGDGADHSLGLGSLSGSWHGTSRFLAVRKLPSHT